MRWSADAAERHRLVEGLPGRLADRDAEGEGLAASEAIDTTTAGERLVFHVFGALGEFERELIVERTRAELAAARARGRRSGRPEVMTPERITTACRLRDEDGLTLDQIAATIGVSRASVVRALSSQNPSRIEKAIAALEISEFGPWPTDYAGLVVNAHTLTLHTWWSQEPPAELIERVRSAAPEVRLEVNTDAPWDKNTTTAAAKRLLPTARERFGIDSITVKQDGSGLVAYHSPGTKPDESGLLRDAGVSVTLVEAEASEPLTGSRQVDQAPHTDGSMITRSTSGGISVCSTGFSVLRPDGTGYLLSAAHCGPASLAWANNRWTGGQWDGDFFIPSNASQNYTPLDAKIMDPVGGTEGRIYGGGWNSTTRRNVQGSEANFTGQTVAMSAGNTGERAVKIWHDNFQTNCAAGGAPSVACEVPLISTMDVQAANNNTPGDEAPFISKSGNTPTDSSTASSGATSTATADDLGVVAESVTGIVESDASSAEMADLVIDEDAGSVTVWLSGEPSSALVAELQEAAEAHGVALVIDSAEHSEAELMSIGADLWDRNDEWSTRGFTIDGYWSTAAGLHIWTDGDVEAARDALSSVPEIVEIEDAGGSDAGPGFVKTPAPPPGE